MGAPGVGGIEFAHVDLAHARRLKEEIAADQFRRIGRLDLVPHVLPAASEAQRAVPEAPGTVSGAPGTGDARTGDARTGTSWRTRVQLAVDEEGRSGMHAARSHAILPVDTVPLAVPELDALGLHRERFPGLDRLELTAGLGGGAVVAHGTLSAEVRARLLEILDAADGEWSLLLRRGEAQRNRGSGKRSGGRRSRGRRGRTPGVEGGAPVHSAAVDVVAGTGFVTERVRGIARDFRLRGDGFWQVHVDAAPELAARVVELTAGAGSVLDLYCGAGLFSIAVAESHGIPVHGMEGASEAIDAARRNAEAGDPLDAEFTVARIERLDALPAAEAVVVDPPRAGLGEAVTDLLGASAAERIVYVSCDGATFARDARALTGHGFRLDSTEAHDYFPLTAHTEFVSVFSR